MQELFETGKQQEALLSDAPLADRMRPRTADEVLGQEHILGEGAPLRKFFEEGDFPSMIFWGPPGVGKTTIAYLIADSSAAHFKRLSAVDSGVKDVRQVIASAEAYRKSGKRTLLFIDEIHRFNKAQQDAFLHAVEKGIITLIGATTENPSFEVNAALLSRCQVYRLNYLKDEDIKKLIERALKSDELLKTREIKVEDLKFLTTIAAGDARTAMNALELALKLYPKNQSKVILKKEDFEKALQQKTASYDKKGESHYDTISAFIKTLRGSDPDAALFWLAKMLEAGEDPKFIARRMVIFASEDIGNADPFALTHAISVFQAVNLIGMPECRINLAHGVTYLASCAKSNASYMGIEKAQADVKKGFPLTVPLHLRNAPTQLMKDEGYHEGYKYVHDFPGSFVQESYFPADMKPKAYYLPGNFGKEGKFKERLETLWKDRYE